MDEVDYEFDNLVEEGCFTKNGDLVNVDWPKFRALHPTLAEEMWKDHCVEVDAAIESLIEKGLLQMSVQPTEDGGIEAVYSTTDLGREYQRAMFEAELDSLMGLDGD